MADESTAQVTLDAATVAKIESTLRDALVDAACVNIVHVSDPTKPAASVTLDPATVARFTEHLRSGLAGAAAVNIAEHAAVDEATGKVR